MTIKNLKIAARLGLAFGVVLGLAENWLADNRLNDALGEARLRAASRHVALPATGGLIPAT